MSIWKSEFTLDGINQIGANTATENLGIQFTAFGEDWLEATMPVDHRTVQPARILHGGASVLLAETVGSVASFLCLSDHLTQRCVGLEINASHLKAAREGSIVRCRCKPARLGRTIHVWELRISNEVDEATCIVRLTMAVIERAA